MTVQVEAKSCACFFSQCVYSDASSDPLALQAMCMFRPVMCCFNRSFGVPLWARIDDDCAGETYSPRVRLAVKERYQKLVHLDILAV